MSDWMSELTTAELMDYRQELRERGAEGETVRERIALITAEIDRRIDAQQGE